MNLQLSANIKKLRRDRGMTQDELAGELGISYQAVSRWETGLSYPDVELLPTLAAIFGVSMDVLFGMDEANEERKIAQYKEDCDALENVDEQIKLTRQLMAEFPANTYLRSRLITLYRVKGGQLSAARLDELRKLCTYVIENTTPGRDWWRVLAINDMICLEEDDHLDVWLSALDNRAVLSSARALIARYDYRGEVENYNQAIQREIVASLIEMFYTYFGKRDAKSYKNAQSRVESQKLILATIDLYRDPATDLDAWLDTRSFMYLRLAGGEFGSGHIEEGYAALDKAVELAMRYDDLPEGTELSYHCPALDELTEVKEGAHACRDLLELLTVSAGWEWLDCVRGEDRFLSILQRLKTHCGE